MEKTTQSRRTFIKTVALLLGSLALLRKYLTPKAILQRRVVVTIPAAEVPGHGALVYKEARVALFSDQGRLYALSLVCTHLGCTLNVSDRGLACPCHGSLFDLDGQVLKGPAERPLQKLKVERTADTIEVVA